MRRWGIPAVAVVVAGAAATVAGGSPAADDVSAGIQIFNGTDLLHPTTTPGSRFKLAIGVNTSSGVAQTIVVRTSLPDGLRWGADGPDAGEGCSQVNPAVCQQALLTNGAGTVEGGYVWDVIADRIGGYDVTATVEPEQPDPNLANNTATLHFEVVPDAGGGAQGGGGTAKATASTIKLSPAKPKAGSMLVAAVRVTKGGSAVRPTRVRCTASVGAFKGKGTGKAVSGVASCGFKTPKSAKGKRLSGSVSFSAGGTSFTKRFTVKLT